jgi:hypothetical protein
MNMTTETIASSGFTISNRPRELEGHPEWERAFDRADRWVRERLANAREGRTWHWAVVAPNGVNPTFELNLGYGDSFLSDYFSLSELSNETEFKNRVGSLWIRFVNFKIHETESDIKRLLRELKEDNTTGRAGENAVANH